MCMWPQKAFFLRQRTKWAAGQNWSSDSHARKLHHTNDLPECRLITMEYQFGATE